MKSPEREADAVDPDEQTVAVASKQFARRRRGLRWRRARPYLLVVLVLTLLGSGIWLVYFSSALTVREVKVEGNSALSSARIESVAQVPTGRQLARVDLAAIQARIESDPSIKGAAISRSWPHTVLIEVTERVPVAVVDRGTGLQAVDEDGVLFDSYRHRPDGMPLIRTSADIGSEALAEAAAVIDSLPRRVQRLVNHLDVRSVDRIELLLHDGRRVLWGSAEHSAQKAEVLVALLEHKAQRIDVSVPERPTTR